MARIAIVTPDIVGPVKNGGIGSACFHYARTLATANYQVDILFSGDVEVSSRQHWQSWYAERGINFLSMQDVPQPAEMVYGGEWYIERAWAIMDFLRRRQYNYILFQDWHANGFWTARAKQMAAGFADTPIAIITHSPNQWQKEGMQSFGDHPVQEYDMEWAEKEAIAAADILVSPSRHMIDWLTGHDYKLPPRVAICPYTFEDEVQPGNPAAVDNGHLIFFGRLETRKGLHLMAGALRALQAEGKPLPQTVSLLGKHAQVGGQPSADYITDLQRDLPRIAWVVETNFDYAAAIDYIHRHNGVVVIPSILDNLPLTVIESITKGFCFIAARTGGIPEMIDPAIGFEPTVAGLKAKIETLTAIDFSGLRHLYDPVAARRTWLDHVADTIAAGRPRPAAAPAMAREEIPPISVCVPFYRHDRYIRRMVSGFLRMELPQLQLVVVDDGTPAAERVEYDSLRASLEPLGHVFHTQPNAGPGAARNRAAALARHDLLLFFDADNAPFPELVERLWAAMRHSGADSIAAAFAAVPPMERSPVARDIRYLYRASGGSLVRGLFDNVLGDVCSLVRRASFDAAGGFSERHSSWEDWEFFLRLLASGHRHLGYPDPLFFYTDNPGGRHSQSRGYDCRVSLFDCLAGLPAPVAAEVARVLAMEYFVAAHHGDRILDLPACLIPLASNP